MKAPNSINNCTILFTYQRWLRPKEEFSFRHKKTFVSPVCTSSGSFILCRAFRSLATSSPQRLTDRVSQLGVRDMLSRPQNDPLPFSLTIPVNEIVISFAYYLSTLAETEKEIWLFTFTVGHLVYCYILLFLYNNMVEFDL